MPERDRTRWTESLRYLEAAHGWRDDVTLALAKLCLGESAPREAQKGPR